MPPPPETGPSHLPEVKIGFIALYAVAQMGAYIAFMPLLQVLLPLQAAAIDPVHSAVLLSRIGLAGAVVASVANVAFGVLSDRTRIARGSRQPWILGGLAATLGSYALLGGAARSWSLLAGSIAFQLAFNALFAPLNAIVADYVPERQRGVVSALLGLGLPLGSLAGLASVSAWPMRDAWRYGLIGVLVAACVLPLALRLRTQPGLPRPMAPPRADGDSLRRLVTPDFIWVWASRMCVVTTLGIIQSYMLLYLRQRGLANHLLARPEVMMTQMTAIATACNVGAGLMGGLWSDRIGHRKPFVIAGGLLLACGMLCVALVPSWPGLCLAAMLYGAGNGVYSTLDLALMVQVLPSMQRAGQYLGIMNLSNTVAQVIAPLLALLVLRGAAPDYRALFLLAAIASLLGAVCISGVRGRG